jgi:Protein of unknown function (DUF1189)
MNDQTKAIREIDKPFYNYWQALYHSFFNPRLYVDVGKRWKGYGITYFLFLMFIVTLPFSLRVLIDFNRFFQDELILPFEQIPKIYIQNGQVKFAKPMPYLIKNKQGQVVIAIDTTGTIKSLNDKNYPYLNILITKDKLFYRFPQPKFFFSTSTATPQKVETYVTPFRGLSDSVFEGKEWVSGAGLKSLEGIFGLMMYPALAFIFFGVFLVLLLVLALMGQVAAKLLGLSINYKQCCRLILVSVTPAMVVLWLLLVLAWMTKGYGFIIPVLLVIYFCYAVLALKRESQKLVRS